MASWFLLRLYDARFDDDDEERERERESSTLPSAAAEALANVF